MEYLINAVVFCGLVALWWAAAKVRSQFVSAATHQIDKHPYCHEARD